MILTLKYSCESVNSIVSVDNDRIAFPHRKYAAERARPQALERQKDNIFSSMCLQTWRPGLAYPVGGYTRSYAWETATTWNRQINYFNWLCHFENANMEISKISKGKAPIYFQADHFREMGGEGSGNKNRFEHVLSFKSIVWNFRL